MMGNRLIPLAEVSDAVRTTFLDEYGRHMAGEHRYTHLSYDQALASRDRRNAPPDIKPQEKSAATKRANARAAILAQCAVLRGQG